MTRRLLLVFAVILLALLALLLRPAPPSPPPSAAAPLPEIEPLRPSPRPAPQPRAVAEGWTEAAPERLLPFLEKLGRARLVRDRRRLLELWRDAPPVHESDVPWIVSRLQGELFVAAGACELVRAFQVQRSAAELGEILSHPAHPFLKDVAIETLESLASGGASVVLLAVARNDPDEGVRSRAVAALGSFQGPEIHHALVGALGDGSPLVRRAASAALARMPSREAVEVLLRALSTERDPRIQVDLARAAASAGGREEAVRALQSSPAAVDALLAQRRAWDGSRYGAAYPAAFFEPGQPAVPFRGRKIGITVETAPGVTLADVTAAIFQSPPFDRYREWFRFRRAEEFPLPRAYDGYGNPAGDVPYDELDGTVYVRFRDPESFLEGVLGYTKGCEAFVTGASLLHELGHAFAGLGDEYAGGSADEAANLSAATPAPWEPLARLNLLPAGPVRRDASLFVPSGECAMTNRPEAARFCPVCQLEIHARIASLAGAPLPW